jgi:ABC-type bacteriocin/lantibiotic exporter with double-glycine peptidase domain
MLPVPDAAQISDGACLPACAQMVLAYYGRQVSQTQLIRLLGTTDAGTPFSRLRLLSQLGVTVDIHADGTLAELQVRLPAIVGLHAGRLSGHSVESQHAVVVIDIEAQGIRVLDPAQGADPILLSENEFLAAWIEMDCIFAVVGN